MNYITISPYLSASISLYGYMYDKTTNVFVSGHNLKYVGDINVLNPVSLTAVNHFSNSRRVSAICPAFTGTEIYSYKAIDENRMIVYLYGLIGTGNMDIIFYNRAGYTKLSDEKYLINFTYSPTLTGVYLTSLNDVQLVTINNLALTAIQYGVISV